MKTARNLFTALANDDIGWAFDLSGLRLGSWSFVPQAWLVLALVAAGLRFVNLGAESLWYDEAFTAWMAKLPLDNLWAAVRGDVHPPLWYLIEWANVRLLGDSAFALRLPSALLGIVAVLLVRRIALALGLDKSTAFLAGLLAAVMPAALYYSQDARMYPLLSVFVLLMVNAAIRRGWLVFALAGIGAVYTQNLGALYVGAIGLAVVAGGARDWRSLRGPFLAGLVIVAAWLPWWPSLLYQVRGVTAGFWMQPLTVGGAVMPYLEMIAGWRVGDSLQINVYVAVLGMSVIGLIVCRRWLFTRAGSILLALVVGAAGLGAGLSLAWRSIYLSRAFLPACMGLMIVWAYGLIHLSKDNRRLAWLIAVPALAVGLVAHYFPAQGGRVDMPAALAPVRAGWRPGDVLYFLAIDGAISIRYYTADLPYALLPETTDLNQSLTEETKRAMGMVETPFDSLASEGYRRAWLISSVNPLVSAKELDEFDRIAGRYPAAELIERSGTDYVNSSIYLVNLQ